jgi:TnpA family transposase
MVRVWTRYSDRMRESPYHESDLKIEEYYTDSARFTHHVFALCHLLGFRFAPRIRDLAGRRISVPEKGNTCPARFYSTES